MQPKRDHFGQIAEGKLLFEALLKDQAQTQLAGVIDFERTTRDKAQGANSKDNRLKNGFEGKAKGTIDENVVRPKLGRQSQALPRRFRTEPEIALEMAAVPMVLFWGGACTAGKPFM